MEAAPCGIIQVSLDRAILKANSVAQDVLGLMFDELSRRFVAGFESETFREDGSVCPAHEHPVSKYLATDQPRPPTHHRCAPSGRTDGMGVFTAIPVSDPESVR